MAQHSILLQKTEEARLRALYQSKCDEVSKLIQSNNMAQSLS